jgi:hypothetical protein
LSPAAEGGTSMALWSERRLIALPEAHGSRQRRS